MKTLKPVLLLLLSFIIIIFVYFIYVFRTIDVSKSYEINHVYGLETAIKMEMVKELNSNMIEDPLLPYGKFDKETIDLNYDNQSINCKILFQSKNYSILIYEYFNILSHDFHRNLVFYESEINVLFALYKEINETGGCVLGDYTGPRFIPEPANATKKPGE